MELQRLKNQIEEEIKKFNGMHKKAQQLVQARNSLLEQQSQNGLVLSQIEQLQQNARIFKQVGSVLIDQSRKQAITTLSHRLGHIRNQLESTAVLITKNESQQKQMTEKITKAKQAFVKMSQHSQQQ